MLVGRTGIEDGNEKCLLRNRVREVGDWGWRMSAKIVGKKIGFVLKFK